MKERNLTAALSDLLDTPVRIGLYQQGHIPIVELMLSEGADWEEIGQAIGWHGDTARRWYEAETAALAAKLTILGEDR